MTARILSLASTLSAWTAVAAAAPALPVRTASEPKAVFLTVYNTNLALIRELRDISLEKGGNRVLVPDIPATIDATSLHFTSLDHPDAVSVLEQNYQYDLVNQQKLMEKYIGKQIEFFRLDELTKKEYSVAGRLLAVNPGVIAEIGGKIEINPAGRMVLPRLPEGLVLRPQLEWMLATSQGGAHRAELSYLAGGLSWRCDYVALLDKADDRLDLQAWVTLENHSGTAFRNAGLKLVAGDVNVVQPVMQDFAYANGSASLGKREARPQFTQKELFEYKLYALERKTDLASNETKQIELASAKQAKARKFLVYDGQDQGWRWWLNNPSYRSQGSLGQGSNPKVGVYVAFRNDEKSGLGLPLPKGKLRVYKRDDDGKEQFVGEDNLDHTAKDEEVRLYLGNAFDVVGSRVQSDFRVVSSGHVVEESFEIKVRNHKQEDVEVMIYEHPWRWSQWEIVKKSAAFEKVDQTTLRFPVRIGAGKEKTVTYTVRYTW